LVPLISLTLLTTLHTVWTTQTLVADTHTPTVKSINLFQGDIHRFQSNEVDQSVMMGTEVGMQRLRGDIEKNAKLSFDWYVTSLSSLLIPCIRLTISLNTK
jgi:hypothetical protein